jgi:hypothetical protein
VIEGSDQRSPLGMEVSPIFPGEKAVTQGLACTGGIVPGDPDDALLQAPRVSATFSGRRGLRRILGVGSLERRVHLPPLSGGRRAVPLR